MRRSPLAARFATVLVVTLATLFSPLSSTDARAATSVSRVSAPSAVTAGSVYAVRVRVSGTSRPVLLQRKVGTDWRRVASARTAANDSATLRWTAPSQAGRVTLRVQVPRTSRLPGAATRAWTVTVRPRATTSPAVDLGPLLEQVLELVNVARAVPRLCGGVRFAAVRPLTVDSRLTRAARDFAQLMANRDFFDHNSPDGADPGDRITAAGYPWRAYGENIAAGHDGAIAVVNGWLASAGHCKNLMSPTYTQVGLGYAFNAGSRYGSYWVQDFAAPR